MNRINISKKDLREVERIAAGAGEILLKHSENIGKIIHKGNGAGLLTEADGASEEYIITELGRAFPEVSFLAEESGISASKNNRRDGNQIDSPSKSDFSSFSNGRWIIDPLDGTNNFAHGFPWYCVSIGLELDREMVLGVIYQPVLKEMFSALKNQGAWLNEKEILVSKVEELKDALLTVGFYYYKDDVLRQEIERFGRVHQQVLGIRRPGSAALDIAYVACGRLDGFWERGLNPWDMAAGYVIAGEAGASITDYEGRPFSIYGKEILLTNSLLHSKLIPLLK